MKKNRIHKQNIYSRLFPDKKEQTGNSVRALEESDSPFFSYFTHLIRNTFVYITFCMLKLVHYIFHCFLLKFASLYHYSFSNETWRFEVICSRVRCQFVYSIWAEIKFEMMYEIALYRRNTI